MRNKLLIKLLATLVGHALAILLLFPDVLKWTFIVTAGADVDKLVTGWLWYLRLHCMVFAQFQGLQLLLLFCVSDSTRFHHHT